MELKAGTEKSLPPAQERKLTGTHRLGSKGDAWLRGFTSLLVLLFPTVTLFVNRGDSYVFGLLMLVGVYVWLRDGARVWLDRYSGALWIAFVLFFAVAVLSYLVGVQTEDGFHFLGRYLRFLLIAPVYLAFRRYPPTAKTVFIGLALGALVSGALSMLQFLHTHAPFRMAATTDLSIIFGDLAATMVLCTALGLALISASKRVWAIPLALVCLAGGVGATLFSGTRGAWLSLLILIPLLVWVSARASKKRNRLVAMTVVIIAVFSSFYFVVRTDTAGRIKQAINGIADYYVAVKSLHGYALGEHFTVHCNDSQSFLNAWMKFDSVESSSGIQANIVSDSLLGYKRVCMRQWVVRLHNFSVSAWGRYVFPRMPPAEVHLHSTTAVVVRGRGAFVYGRENRDQTVFDFSSYQRVVIDSATFPERLIVWVAPERTVWIVPLENYYGEYSLSITKTSVGQRFELWRAAWYIFLQHPLLGVGTGAFQSSMRSLIAAGRTPPFVGGNDHPHNDYLNALVSSGIIGLLVLLAVFGLPVWHFSRGLRSPHRQALAASAAGLLTVIGFAIYALTDTIFLHSMMITWYVIYMALFYALIRAAQERRTGTAH